MIPPNRTKISQSSNHLVVRNSSPPIFYVFLLIGATLPLSVTFQMNQNFISIVMEQPWGNYTGPLSLIANNDFPRESRNNFPIFNGYGTTST